MNKNRPTGDIQQKMLLLSVIIVTWNGMEYLPACFEALMPQLPRDAEVVLVDNGSSDQTLDWAQRFYPSVRLVALPFNLGFAGGVNAGLRVARGGLLFLLNNDAFVEPGCIERLLALIEQRPEIGAVGAVLTFAHQPSVVASAGILLRRDGLALDLWAGRGLDDLPCCPEDIFGPTGAAALYRRSLLEDVGLMEPTFFNYLEDVDLAWRALLRGWRSVVEPRAHVRHVYSATSGHGSPFKQRLLGRNRVRTIVRCMPGPLLLRSLPAVLGYEALAVIYAALARQPAIIEGRLEALRDLSGLLRERRELQSRRSISLAAIERWLAPTTPPWKMLSDQRHLAALLQRR